MSYNEHGKVRNTSQRLRWSIAAFALAAAAHAQPISPPPAPGLITPPEGHSAFLVGHAIGTQGYVCLPTTPGASTASWTVKPARPEATLSQTVGGHNFQLITHFLSPNENPNDIPARPIPFGNATWQSVIDTSRVWAQVFLGNASIPAGSDPSSCPNNNSIACLLLQTVGSQPGPTGGNILSKTTFIQRLNTKGGLAPNAGCAGTADVGNQVLVPYTADYFFYAKDKEK